MKEENAAFEKKRKALIEYERLLLGLTRIALHTQSWLCRFFPGNHPCSCGSRTTHRVDMLRGLKENVIIGRLIPAGETFRNTPREPSIRERTNLA